jgi:hypothetical protein
MKNLSLFKDSIEEIQLRRPNSSRLQSFRQRTVSDQPNELKQRNSMEHPGILKKPNDVFMINIKNQLNDLNLKFDDINKKLETISELLSKT